MPLTDPSRTKDGALASHTDYTSRFLVALVPFEHLPFVLVTYIPRLSTFLGRNGNIAVMFNVIGRCDPGRSDPGQSGARLALTHPPPIILRNRNDVDFVIVAFNFTTTRREEANSGWRRVAS